MDFAKFRPRKYILLVITFVINIEFSFSCKFCENGVIFNIWYIRKKFETENK